VWDVVLVEADGVAFVGGEEDDLVAVGDPDQLIGSEVGVIGNPRKSSTGRIVAFENLLFLWEFLQFSNNICGQ